MLELTLNMVHDDVEVNTKNLDSRITDLKIVLENSMEVDSNQIPIIETVKSLVAEIENFDELTGHDVEELAPRITRYLTIPHFKHCKNGLEFYQKIIFELCSILFFFEKLKIIPFSIKNYFSDVSFNCIFKNKEIMNFHSEKENFTNRA